MAIYREPGVADACLVLQNQHGFDVNLVLFCIWHGLYRGLVPNPLLQQALEFSLYWKDLGVQPLRDVRTAMKRDARLQALASAADINALRENIKGLELKAEQIQQQELQRLADGQLEPNEPVDLQVDTPQRNLKDLCQLTGCDWHAAAPQFQLILESASKPPVT